MATPSVSFRISRSAEDLAGTLHLLSQRLVQLEQRLAALEGREHQEPEEDPALETSLGNAERLLLDCRSLLEGALQTSSSSEEAPGISQWSDPEPAVAARLREDAVAGSGVHDELLAAESDPEIDPEAELESDDLGAIPLFEDHPSDTAVA